MQRYSSSYLAPLLDQQVHDGAAGITVYAVGLNLSRFDLSQEPEHSLFVAVNQSPVHERLHVPSGAQLGREIGNQHLTAWIHHFKQASGDAFRQSAPSSCPW